MLKKLLPCILFIVFFQIIKAQNEFITIWKPSLPSSTSLGIPNNSNEHQAWFPGKGTNYTIYWEEIGYPSHHNTMQNISSDFQVLIDFGTPLNPAPNNATYRVKISNGIGNFHQIQFLSQQTNTGNQPIGIVGDVNKIVNIEQWGNIKWSSMNYAFSSCVNLDVAATDIPDLSEATDMSYMFLDCKNFISNPTIDNWNISNITNLEGIFYNCYLFNQPVGNWDTSNITNLKRAFAGCFLFNQPIGNWNISNVTNLSETFLTCYEFDQPLENWNTSNATSMAIMFMSARKFNQPLASWNTSKVTSTASMFLNASKFNQPIESWDMSHNIESKFMFFNATQFNQPLGNWNTSQINDMMSMFNNAKNFNQDISSWDTGNVQNMNNMFSGAEQFNGDLSNWNVSKVKDMSYMFSGAKKFNQNLGKWRLNSLQLASNILKNTALTCENYDNTLYGWSQNTSLPSNINISSVSPLVYSHSGAVTARNYLINDKGWTITGDIYDGECASQLGTSDIKTDNKISIYPNPATDIIYLKNIQKPESYTIYDISGRMITKDFLHSNTISIESLSSGNYILHIITQGKSHTFKFIKK